MSTYYQETKGLKVNKIDLWHQNATLGVLQNNLYDLLTGEVYEDVPLGSIIGVLDLVKTTLIKETLKKQEEALK